MPKLKRVSCNKIVNFAKETGFYKESNILKDYDIYSYSSLYYYEENSIVFIKNSDIKIDFSNLKDKNLLIVSVDLEELKNSGLNYIISDSPRDLFFQIINNFILKEELIGISNYARIYTDNIGRDAYIGDNVYLCKDVMIGNNVKIYPNVSIICPCRIGDNTTIFSGTVIGADGFGMYKDISGKYHQIPHVGGVQIGKSVIIGSNTCIDRGTIDDTIIEDYAKIDDHVNIAHNVRIGKNSLVVALSGIGGSAIIGDNSYIAPSVLLNNGIKFGPYSMAGLGSIVLKDVEEHKKVFGNPARIIGDF